MHLEIHDVVIVRGSGAGTTAASSLAGRQRTVLVCGAEKTIQRTDQGSTGITELEAEVEDIGRRAGGYMVRTSDGNCHAARAVLLQPDSRACALELPGARDFEGSSVHECPYCDGWDHRDRKLGVVGSSDAAVGLAVKLLRWSSNVTVFSHGDATDAVASKQLEKRRIRIRDSRVTALEGEGRKLGGLRFEDGAFEACDALFFPAARKYHSSLVGRLGCDLERMPEALEWNPGNDSSAEGIFLLTRDGHEEARAIHDWLAEADQPPAPKIVSPNFRPHRRPVVFARQ